jgi:hypothetical protein
LLRYALVARARLRVRIVEQLLKDLFQMEGELERFRKAIQSLRFPYGHKYHRTSGGKSISIFQHR